MVITNPGELHQGYFTVGGNWEGAECGCFLQGTSQASSHLGWLCFSLWTPPLLPSGADLAFWGPLFTFSSNSCTHTHPWEQPSSDFALAALACVCWQKVMVKFRADHLTGKELGNWLFEEICRHPGTVGCSYWYSKWRHYVVVRMEVKWRRGYNFQTKAQRNRVFTILKAEK